jgi:FMN phosphatase YigB (HAD superfamily)
MNKVIIFDFNWTLFNPAAARLAEAAFDVLDTAKQKDYTLVMLAVAKPERSSLISSLGIEPYFSEINLVEGKSPAMFTDIATRYEADLASSYVVGDRAHREVLHGHTAGWRTIWLQAGKFASELPVGYTPDYVVTSLSEVSSLI